MRRYWICAVLFFSCALILFPGIAFKAGAYLKTGGSLNYSRVYFEGGRLALEEFAISKENRYILRSEKISVGYHWPFRFSIELLHPHLTLSSDIFKPGSKSIQSGSMTAFIEDGTLDWLHGELPPGRFSLQSDAFDLKICLKFEQGKIEIHNERIVGKEIPLQLLERFAAIKQWGFPLKDSQGVVDADYDGKVLKAIGRELSFQWKNFACGGSFSLDWQRPEGYAIFPGAERLRLSVEKGRVENVKEIDLQASFQAGVGGKVECHAMADAIPLEFEGRAFISPDGKSWLAGDGKLGDALIHGEWKEEGGKLLWQNLGPSEGRAIQAFTRLKGEWVSGIFSGQASYREAFRLDELRAEELFVKINGFNVGAKRLAFNQEECRVEGGWFDEFQWDGQIGASGKIEGRYRNLPAKIEWKEGKVEGSLGQFQFNGNYVQELEMVTVEIAQGNGPLFWGDVDALQANVVLTKSGIEDWSLACSVSQAAFPDYHLSNIDLEIHADKSAIDLSADGLLTIRSKTLPIKARKCRLIGEELSFDIRVEDHSLEMLRLVGVKNGPNVEINPDRSRIFGAPVEIRNAIWDRGALQQLSFETSVDWENVDSFLQRERSWPVGIVRIAGNYDCGWNYKIEGTDWNAIGTWSDEGFNGKAQFRGMTCEYIGKDLEGKLQLRNIHGEIGSISPIQGIVDGEGSVIVSSAQIEADFALAAPKLVWGEYQLDNNQPLHLSYTSGVGMVISGIDGKLVKNGHEVQGKIERLGYDAMKQYWNLQRAQLHIPPNFYPVPGIEGAIDFVGDVHFSNDFSEIQCNFSEAFIPIVGEVRSFKNLHATQDGVVNAEIQLNQQWAKISLDLSKGTLLMDNLRIDWRDNFRIDAIEGSFGGVQCTFLSSGDQLIGQAFVDFRQLIKWIPPEIAAALNKLEMGDGYELKGAFDQEKFEFQGILTGKQFDLFGVQLKTLMANILWKAGKLKVSNIDISDSALKLNIDEIRIDGSTIAMPNLTIEDLRPSLLRKRGKETGDLSPLQVRNLSIRGFQGSLDNEKTYTARGNLSFINTFKRVETLFDLPSNIFSRVIGIDLDLLVPVMGDLTFEIRDGYVWLNELKNAYSEGKRSEFFLVKAGTSPRMDLDGNIDVHVRMKQYVLLALTEGFMIGIEGSLSEPKFSLQKRMRFFDKKPTE